MLLPFRDRHEAGRCLADRLHCYSGNDTVVLALPRGGVPIGYEIAHALHLPLEVFLLRNLVHPGSAHGVFGVVGTGGVRVLDGAAIAALGLTQEQIDEITQRERISLMARERTYRGANDLPELGRRIVLLADDGLTPLAQLRSLVHAVAVHEPRAIILAIPVVVEAQLDALRLLADDLVYISALPAAERPEQWYRELAPVSHTEVRALLSLVQAEAQSRELAGA
jgi:putative phosphoribosyl transferase